MPGCLKLFKIRSDYNKGINFLSLGLYLIMKENMTNFHITGNPKHENNLRTGFLSNHNVLM